MGAPHVEHPRRVLHHVLGDVAAHRDARRGFARRHHAELQETRVEPILAKHQAILAHDRRDRELADIVRKHGEEGSLRRQAAASRDVQQRDRRPRLLVGDIQNDGLAVVPAAHRLHGELAHLEELVAGVGALQFVVADRREGVVRAMRDAGQRAAGEGEEVRLADLDGLVDLQADGEVAIQRAALAALAAFAAPVNDRLEHGEHGLDGGGDVADHLVENALGLRALVAEHFHLAENKAGVGRSHVEVPMKHLRLVLQIARVLLGR